MNSDTHQSAHRIEITPNGRRCRVIHQGVTYADTHASLVLAETGLAPVLYFPRADVNMAASNARSTRRTARSRARPPTTIC